MSYAAGTSVPVERSKAEIEKLLRSRGASRYGVVSKEDEGRAFVGFTLDGASFRFEVPLPTLREATAKPRRRLPPGKLREQMMRERWRAVVLLIKAKLEMVALGMSSVEQQFFSDMILPSGRTTRETMADLIRRGLADDAPPQLPG